MGNWFIIFLIGVFILATIAFACSRDWARVLYCGGAVLLNLGVLWMR